MSTFVPPTDAELIKAFHLGHSIQFLAVASRQKHSEIRRRLHKRHVFTHIGYHFRYRAWEINRLAFRLGGWYDDGASIREMMEATGLKYGQILEFLERSCTALRSTATPLETCPASSATRKQNQPMACPISEDDLRKRYVVAKESMGKIAKDLGVADRLVKRWLREFGIPLRTRAQAYALRSGAARSSS